VAYIEFKHIEKHFGNKHVLKDINLTIEQGQFVTLLGSSGCGKTTLLRCFAGLEIPDSGTIMLDGEDITNKSVRSRNLGMIFQQYSLFPTMTVYDNIAFGLKMRGVDRDKIDKSVKEVIKMVELTEHTGKYPSMLSGGEQQRVALARSLVVFPKVLLLDEPLSAIDAKLRTELQGRIKEIHKELNMTSIFVTHNQIEAMRMSDIIFLFSNDGYIEQSGTPSELYTNPKTIFAASFIGNYNMLSVDEFKLITKAEKLSKDGTTVAIRPEVIEIANAPFDVQEDLYYMTGKVVSNILQQSVIKYLINVEGVKIKVDVKFDTPEVYKDDEVVSLAVNKKNLLIL
jgi:putative spermidine/putrescine transport system ATP-binding protein